MKIKIERSGGLAPITNSSEIDVKDLPPELIPTTKKIMQKQKTLSARPPPRGAADYYSYKIVIQDGSKKRELECNQFNMDNDLKTLVKYVESH